MDEKNGKTRDQETLVRLLQVAAQDKKIGAQLKALVDLPAFQRRSAVNTWLSHMQISGAPKDFIRAVAVLLDDRAARDMREFLAGMG